MDPLLAIRAMLPTLHPAFRRIAERILGHPGAVVRSTISQVAESAQVSNGTVVKFCQTLGYEGFSQFRMALAQAIAVRYPHGSSQIQKADAVEDVKQKTLQMHINALRDTACMLNVKELDRAIRAICAADKVYLFGLGASGLVAKEGEEKLAQIGLRALAVTDTHMQLTRAALLDPSQVVVGISARGYTYEVCHAMTIARQAGAATIGMTATVDSPLARAADIVLLTSFAENTVDSSLLSARIVQLCAVEVLAVGVALRSQRGKNVNRSTE